MCPIEPEEDHQVHIRLLAHRDDWQSGHNSPEKKRRTSLLRIKIVWSSSGVTDWIVRFT